MNMRLIGLVACVAIASQLLAATSYNVANGKLTITVPAGETNNVVAAELAPMTNNQVTDVEKLGQGCIIINVSTLAYMGDIHIKEGTWRVINSAGLGKLSTDSRGLDVGSVFISDGATLDECCVDSPVYKGKRITVSGYGVNGLGALLISDSTRSNYGGSPWGSNLTLEGDTYANSLCNTFWYMNYNPNYLTLNGHKFIVCGGKSSNKFVVMSGLTANDVGTIVATNGTIISFQGSNYFYERQGQRGKFVMQPGAKFNGNNWRGRYEWDIEWDSSSSISPNTLTVSSDPVTNKAALHGPVLLKQNMNVSIPQGSGFALMGPVSGNYMLKFNGSGGAASTNFVHIGNAGNTFTGGVSANLVNLKVYCDGTLPKDGGVVAMTNSSITFVDGEYKLPNAEFVNTPDCRVAGGRGSWKTFKKVGLGTAMYNSAIGADVLDLQNGTIEVYGEYTKIAGLVEGADYYSTSSDAINKVQKGIVATARNIQLGPRAMNSNHLIDIRNPAGYDPQTWYNISYSGYIWNRKSEDWTVTFCCDVTTSSSMYIDGKQVIYQGGTYEAKTNTVVLTPGPHAITISNYSKIKDGGSGTSSATNFVWKSLGLRYDPQGRNSTNPEYYEVMQDPGDGSLFTWALPEGNIVHPLDASTVTVDKPYFKEVKFTRLYDSAGYTGYLDGVGGNLTIGTADGLPRVQNTSKFTIETAWKLDVEDILAGRKVTNIALAFGEDAKLELSKDKITKAENPSGAKEWVIAESTTPITGSLSIKNENQAVRWSVVIEDNKVKLKYRQLGMTMIFR